MNLSLPAALAPTLVKEEWPLRSTALAVTGYDANGMVLPRRHPQIQRFRARAPVATRSAFGHRVSTIGQNSSGAGERGAINRR
jgi:hypothetical protein